MGDFNELNMDLVSKYGRSVPYYTSYPVLGRWSEDYNNASYRRTIKDLCKKGGDDPVSLYVHFPYCAKMCYYCICNFKVTHNRDTITRFLGSLFKEIDMLAGLFEEFDFKPRITDIHLGGGTPSYMENDEVDLLLNKLRRLQRPGELKEVTIEIDIRTALRKNIEHYAKAEINRLSFGIQDFNPAVQKAINREQSPELFEQVFPKAMRGDFDSYNFDLLYGLPKQTIESFVETLHIVTDIAPSRVTLLRYAHTPDQRKHMRLINEADLPSDTTNKIIFNNSIQQFKSAGYNHIGIDHFALDTDRLSEADRNKSVGRSFLGFNPGQFQHLLGIGPSSTSSFNGDYSQNISNIYAYCAAIEEDDFAIERGYVLNKDDEIRREIIFAVLCDNRIDLNTIGIKYQLDPFDYFEIELRSFEELILDGLMTFVDGIISVTELGRLYIQHICVRFDKHIDIDSYEISGPAIIAASA